MSRQGTQPPPQYRLYAEMSRLADSLHSLALECRERGETENAIACYEQAKDLAEVCAKFEKAPTRTIDAARGAIKSLEHRFALSDAKRRQHQDSIAVPFTPPNGGPTADERED